MYRCFLPSEKEEKNYMARAIFLAFLFVIVFFTCVILAGLGIIKINIPENLLFALVGIISVVIVVIPCVIAIKGAIQLRSNRTAFLIDGDSIYTFVGEITTGNYANVGNIIAGPIGASVGLAITINEQKKYEAIANDKEFIIKIYNDGWLEKIEEIYSIKQNKDGLKIKCFLTGKTPTNSGVVKTDRKTILYIQNVYEDYDELVNLIKRKNIKNISI